MALTVGELVAYIRADGTQFDSQVDQSGRKFEGLGRVVSAGTKALSTSFVALTTGAVAMGAAVFKVGADYNRLQQSSRAALTTLLGSAEAANAQMDKLDEFARNSPFAKQVFISAQQQLLGFGVAADKVLPTLDAIQNAVAATGGSNEQISALTDIFAKVSSSAKITAEDLNQFGTYGVDAATLIGSQMGMTGAQIRESISKGTLDAGKALDALSAAMMARFGGATANIKQQFDGAADRIKGAWRDIGSVIAAPFIDPNGGGRAVEWANKVADALRALEAKAKPTVTLLVDRFKPGLDAVTPALDRVRGAINSIDLSKLNGGLDQVAKYAPLVAGTSASLFALGTNNIPILSRLGLSLNPVVAGVAAIVATSPGLRAAGADFLTALAPLLPVAQQLVQVLADTAMQVGSSLTPSIAELLGAVAPVAVSLGQQMAPALVQVLQYAVPVADAIAQVVSWAAQLPGPMLAGVAAFTAAVVVLPRLVAGLQGVAATAATVGGALKAAFIGNPVTLAITAIATAIGVFVARSTEAKARVDTFADSIDQATGSITENTRSIVFNNLQKDGLIDKAKRLGISLTDLVDASIDPTSAAFDRLAEAEARARAESGDKGLDFGDLSGTNEALEKLNAYGEVLVAVRGQSEDVAAAQQQVRDQIAAGIGATDGSTSAFRSNAEAVQAANDALQEQIQAQKDAAGAAMSLREAQIQQTESQNAANDAAANGAQVARDQSGAVDLNAESTIAADKALLDLAARNAQVTDAMVKQNASGQELYATTVAQRDAFINTATSMGYTRDEAARLATQYGLIPQTVTTTVKAETSNADGSITQIVERLNNIDGRVVRAVVRVDAQGNVDGFTGVGNMRFNANGSFVPGAGSRVRPMADGGVLGRQAQYARAGSWIVWAEDETGGETYIPHAPSKRARSTQLLDQTAREFGYVLVPANAQPRANGSTPAAAPTQVGPVAAYLTDAQVERLAQAFETGAGRVSHTTATQAVRTSSRVRPR